MIEKFLNLHVGLGLLFFRVFCFGLDHFIPVLLAFVVLGLVSSVRSQEIDSG